MGVRRPYVLTGTHFVSSLGKLRRQCTRASAGHEERRGRGDRRPQRYRWRIATHETRPPPTLKIHRGPNTALNSRRLAGLRARAMLGGVRTKARFFRRSVEAGSASATAAAGKGNSIAYNDRAWIFVPKIKSILSKLTPLVHLAADLPTARMHDQCPRPIL